MCIQVLTLKAQNYQDEQGYYSVTNYSHEEYQGHHQNWFITQDHNGFIYTGNGDGVLEFDGASWRLISSPGLQAVRTVVVDKNNVKWVGADRELGYLTPDSLGILQFKSLKDKIPSSHPLTANVWQIFPERDRILFVTDNMIYCWKDDQFRIILHPGPIYREYQVNGEVYFQISDKGMFRLVGDSLQMINNGERFKNSRIVVAIPYNGNSVLFVSKENGLFVYDGTTINKLESEIGRYLKEYVVYAGQRLPNSTYAFATLRGGVLIMDKFGKRVKEITTKEGILNNQVHGLVVDNHKALWMALQTGISQFEPHLPYSFFDKRSGLEGSVTAITRHRGNLYVGTHSGLFKLDRNSGINPARFHRIQEIERGCFSLLSSGEDLLAATANGTFRIRENEVVEINKLAGTRALYQSKRDSNRVYIGHMHGLSTIYSKNGQWQPEKDLGQIKEDIFSITSDEEGTLWLGTSLHQVIKIDFPDLNDQSPILDFELIKVRRFEEGLPKGSTNIYLIDGEVLVCTNAEEGPIFKLDFKTGKFSSETQFGKKFGLDSLFIYPRAYQNDGRYILLESKPVEGKRYRFSAFRDNTGNYSVQRLYDERFRSTTETHLFWDYKDLVWIGGEMITKYDLGSEFNLNPSFNAHVRKVIVGRDSIAYGDSSPTQLNPTLPYSNGGLRFEFATPSFMDTDANRYQYRLAGFDKQWSEWTKETRKDYTNLPEGEYQFLARAQNVYGDISTTDNFDFEILAPWHRTWWAYIIYVLLFMGLLYALLQWRSRQLKAKNEALEKLVTSRTAEVQHQANQLKIQAEKLLELDKAKSRFFANISHEFRTPLTLIKGPIEQLEQNFAEKLSMENVKMIRRSANRLLNMVNQLLDLSKIDEGSLKLTPTEGNVYKCLRAATSSFNSHAAQRNIDYKVQIPQNVLWASFDRDKLENIIYNLLGNAFKFSNDGSEISFEASYGKHGLQILVSDSGSGIPKEKLPFIFERFYQVDSTTTKEKEGSGIGLSLSRDLIELMDGTVTVSSEPGKGTLFTVQLPIEEIRTGQHKKEKGLAKLYKTPYKKPYAISKADKRALPTILLVEDNIDMRHFITEQLVKFYKVEEAINGAAGLKKAMTSPPDLIITDLMMPRMDGIELCKRIKTDVNTSHIPVIMLTAKAGIDNRIEGLETGADDYLTKPFDAKELLVRTKNLIEQRQKLRELYSNKRVKVDPKKITVTSIDQKFLEELLSLLEDNYTDAEFGVPKMQDALAMSKTQLHRKLKALTNEAPGELLRNFRLKRAAQLLSQKADSVTQIAYQVGFNNLSYFAKCFKELYGVAPSAY